MIRPHEQLILFPVLARPIGRGRWQAVLRGVLFAPHTGSARRELLVRGIARAAGVRHDATALPHLRERLAPFLVDNKRGRRVQVEIAGERVTLGPSTAGGHLSGTATFSAPSDGTTLEYATTPDESPDRRFAGIVRLLPAHGVSVVSDIDDTIKHSNVPDTRDLLRNTFLRRYTAIPPVRTTLEALAHRGAAIHYVSASPWQLFSPLRAFVAEAGLPAGTFHLKAFRVKDRSALSLLAPPDRFKLASIRPLLDAWPCRSFLLLGDSAERDPEIYGALAREHPRQVAGILIRRTPGCTRGDDRYRSAFQGVRRGVWHVRDDSTWPSDAPAIIESLLAGGR